MNFTLNFGEEISLRDIYESGQCFRWQEVGPDAYRIIAGTHVADVAQDGPTKILVQVESGEDAEQKFWSNYFDMDTSYREIRERIPASDTYLTKAAANGAGIRILRQDPWEMIVTFIISQRKNIPAIRTCVDKLCRVAGQRIFLQEEEKKSAVLAKEEGKGNGQEYYRFPTADEVGNIFCCKAEGLRENGDVLCSFQKAGYDSCSLGYRMPYIKNAAGWMETENMEDLRHLSDQDLLNRLMEIKGVGIKVASCIMLFGFHRLNAFPVDVWMNRVLETYYPKGFALQQYAPYAGVMQQYLFLQIRQEESTRQSGVSEI